MGIILDSHNTGTFERKTSAARSVRHPKPLTDSQNPARQITTPVATVNNPNASGKKPTTSPTGTTKYPK